MCGLNPFLFREKLAVGGSLLIIWYSAGGGVCGESVSQPLLLDSVWVFSQSSDLEE